MNHPSPWWYRLAEYLLPDRCREIPEAQNPDRIVLRQVAIWKQHIYLQQFASDEDPRYMHSHPWSRMFAVGLWGAYTEHRIAGPSKHRRAPYLYTMDYGHVHHVQEVTPGHTSIFIGLGRDDSLEHSKYYYGAPGTIASELVQEGLDPLTKRSHWQDHIKVKVKRI